MLVVGLSKLEGFPKGSTISVAVFDAHLGALPPPEGPDNPRRLRYIPRVTAREHHLLWIVPLVVALGVGGWWAFRRTEGPRVDAITPVRQPMVQTIVTSGRVVQRRQSKLGAMIAGTVAEVGVEDGDRVEAEALARASGG